jgi:hypothetical protein
MSEHIDYRCGLRRLKSGAVVDEGLLASPTMSPYLRGAAGVQYLASRFPTATEPLPSQKLKDVRNDQ